MTDALEHGARFCMRCGAGLEWQVDEEGTRRWACPACGWVYYHNPKPCVGALIVRGGKVLLARRAKPPFQGWWDIPGGFMEAGETPEQALVREIAEETHLRVRHVELLVVVPDTYGEEGVPTLNLHYLVEVEPGEPVHGSDVSELAWFGPEGLPDQIAFANGREALAAWQRRVCKKIDLSGE